MLETPPPPVYFRSDFERERLLHDGFVLTPVSLDA
jgi:hypothetical protein